MSREKRPTDTMCVPRPSRTSWGVVCLTDVGQWRVVSDRKGHTDGRACPRITNKGTGRTMNGRTIDGGGKAQNDGKVS